MKTKIISETIRLGTPEDIHKIANIYSASIRQLCCKKYPQDTINHWARSTPAESRLADIKAGSLLVAEVNGIMAGYLVAVPGELMELFIAPKYSGIGLGTRLGELGIKLAQQNNLSPVLLESTINAAPFYEKLGFKEVNRGSFSHGKPSINIPVINMELCS